MLRPSPADLLTGVADALEQTVLGELDRGFARNQVMAAIGIVRRCAVAVDRLGPVLHDDCVDLVGSLRRALAAADLEAVPPAERVAFEATLAAAERVLAATYPPVADLIEQDLALRDVAARLAGEVEGQGHGRGPVESLRELFARMVDREAQLGLSPW
jgi:hypothetical protein